MKRRGLFSALLATALVACGGGADDMAEDTDMDMDMAAEGDAAAMAAEQAAIAAVGDYWETHYNMGHPTMVASVYADSGFVAPAAGGMFEGNPAIEGWLTEGTNAGSQVQIESSRIWVHGDHAMGMGTYTVTSTPEGGEAMTSTGSYMNVLEKMDGEWKIVGTVSNYDAPPPADAVWNPDMEGETPEDAPRYPALIEAYQTAFNAGDAAAIGALYTDDALVAFSNAPMVNGPAGVQQAMAERMTAGSTIAIHEVGGMDFGDGWSAAGGWYQINGPDGNPVQTGIWMNLVELQADGSPKIAMALTNARPAGM